MRHSKQRHEINWIFKIQTNILLDIFLIHKYKNEDDNTYIIFIGGQLWWNKGYQIYSLEL